MATKEVALRKRQQITKANRIMFLWVAGASVLIGFAAVGSVFLYKQIAYNTKVIAAKQETVSTLKQNNKNVDELRSNIRLLNTDQSLNAAKAKEEDVALQVVLDALPADANSLALGSSLQNKLITGIDGLKLETLKVNPVIGVESSAETAVQDASATGADNEITFTMTVSANNPNALKQLLERFEKSIRAINVRTMSLESSGNTLTLTVDASAYYEPARTIELKDKVVKP